MSIWQIIVIFCGGFIAGMINSVAGGGTLVSFPALVWLGRDPIMANATNALALWPGSLAGMFGFRREIGGARRLMLLLGVPSFAGGLVGAFLLLRTPSKTFSALVPYLILFATALFAAQEPLAKLLRRATRFESEPQAAEEPSRAWWIGAAIFQFFVAIYGGYFGAGMGILMLAALGLLGLTDIHRMNGVKNFFAFCINGVAAVYFARAGAVDWLDALVMGAGAIAGGFGGAGLARKLGRRFIRRAVIAIGLVMTLSMLFRRG